MRVGDLKTTLKRGNRACRSFIRDAWLYPVSPKLCVGHAPCSVHGGDDRIDDRKIEGGGSLLAVAAPGSPRVGLEVKGGSS